MRHDFWSVIESRHTWRTFGMLLFLKEGCHCDLSLSSINQF